VFAPAVPAENKPKSLINKAFDENTLRKGNCSPPIKNIFKKIVKTLDKFFGYRFYFSSIGFKKSLGTI
jgi:hypothetical protein